MVLNAAISWLDRFDRLILDAMAYVSNNQTETSAHFELIITRDLGPETAPMGSLLGPIAANCHAAPSPCSTPSVVSKHQRAGMTLARFDVGEVLIAHELSQSLGYRLEQGVRRMPMTAGSQCQMWHAVIVLADDLTEALIPLKEPIEWLELG